MVKRERKTMKRKIHVLLLAGITFRRWTDGVAKEKGTERRLRSCLRENAFSAFSLSRIQCSTAGPHTENRRQDPGSTGWRCYGKQSAAHERSCSNRRHAMFWHLRSPDLEGSQANRQ